MDKTFKDVGVLLYKQVVKESDLRVTLLLKEKGKISAYVRGGARSTSKLRSLLEPFVFCEYIIYDGGNFFSITQGTSIFHFKHVLKEYDHLMAGMRFLEWIDKSIYPAMESQYVLDLLLTAFYYLDANLKSAIFMEAVFIFKLLFLEGYIDIQNCICGRMIDKEEVTVADKGFLCKYCGGKEILSSSKKALFYIYKHPPKEVFNFQISDMAEKELYTAAHAMISYVLEKPFQS